MTIGSKINPNFPIPGIDQSSKGFRDNFGTIKKEIEDLQGKRIQLVGSLISDPIEIGNGTNDVIVPVAVSLTNVQAAGSNLSVQYNNNGLITGSNVFYDHEKLGINTNNPLSALHVIGNVNIHSPFENTVYIYFGPNAAISSGILATNINVDNSQVLSIDNISKNIGIGTNATSRLSVASNENDVSIFHAYKELSDNSIRFSTVPSTSTIGIVLEQRSANSVGGLRLDQNGIVSLHVNESMDANLSDASRVLVILPNNNVGIGSMTPTNQLDVSGNTLIDGHVGIGTAVGPNALGVYGNIKIHNTTVISGIFFADGSFQNTAGGGGGGGGPGTTGPAGPTGSIGPAGPQGTQDHLVFSTVDPLTDTFDTSPYTDSNSFIEVFIDNSYLSVDSYAWTGNTLVLNDPVSVNTTVEIVVYTALSLATNTGPTGPTGPTNNVTGGYTVSSLPSGTLGQIARVTNGAAGIGWGNIVTGGGSTNYLVWYNGINWTILGQ